MKKVLIPILTIILFVGCNDITKHDEGKPNIIIILADDMGWGDLSINGNSDIKTPNIDGMAETGTSFRNFYVSAVCSPTRAELLTGRYAVRGGVYSTSAGGERLDLDETTIAEAFKDNGYKTAAYGKWHNGMQYPYHPNARGFDDFYGYCSGHWGNYFSPMLEHNGEIVKGNGYLTNDLTSKALDFINSNKDTSFFLYLPLNTPHSPMQVPDSLWERFKDKKLNTNHRFHKNENIEHTKAALAMCENIDWNVGRVLNHLKKLNLEENTIVMFFSDNGPNGYRYNGDMKGIKGYVDEGGVKTPFYIQWKGKIIAGREIEQIASGLDLFPTLLEMAGIKHKNPKPFDGISLKSVLLDNKEDTTERYIINNWRNKTSVRSSQFRLDQNNKLYNIVDDPGQFTDVSSQYPQVFEEMKQHKEQWLKEVLSELPEEDSRTFMVGHPQWIHNQLPARDGKAHGNIKRSNKWPNCSFFTNWTSLTDSITWDIEVVEDGNFEAIVYYTCNKENIGSTIELSFGKNNISQKISEAHNPPLFGMEKDRVERGESYVKDFKPLSFGNISLEKGKGTLCLKAKDIASKNVMEVRLIMLNRLN